MQTVAQSWWDSAKYTALSLRAMVFLHPKVEKESLYNRGQRPCEKRYNSDGSQYVARNHSRLE